MKTIVIGHKNPDMDAICSAIAYAELKRKTGWKDVMAARAGNINERIELVLQKFGVPAPDFVSDVSPVVADVMEHQVFAVAHDASIYHAMNSIKRAQLRGLPVIDANGQCLGLLSGWKVSNCLFPRREEAQACRRVVASMTDVVQSFEGQFLAGEPDNKERSIFMMVAAMSLESFAQRLKEEQPNEVLLFVGDREDVQLEAIRAGVLGIVIVGGLGVSSEVRAAAGQAGVYLVSSRYDSATTVLLSRGAAKVELMIEREYISFSPETPLRSARQIAANSPAFFIFPVIDGQKRLMGLLSKSDFLKPIPRQLILVDHNELTQAVKGAGDLQIIEVLDHHRLASFSTDLPILFWNNPVGSTSTLVTLSYQQLGVEIDRPIAGLLMAGLISDTLNLTSPTATPIDAKVLAELSRIAGVKPAELWESIFSVGSPLLTLAPAEVIVADCKDYSEDGYNFSVAQIEELGFSHFYGKKDALWKELEAYRAKQNYYFAALLITDVNTQNSLLLLAAPKEFLATIHYPSSGEYLYELHNVVSRKKQLVPYLLECLHKIKG